MLCGRIHCGGPWIQLQEVHGTLATMNEATHGMEAVRILQRHDCLDGLDERPVHCVWRSIDWLHRDDFVPNRLIWCGVLATY